MHPSRGVKCQLSCRGMAVKQSSPMQIAFAQPVAVLLTSFVQMALACALPRFNVYHWATGHIQWALSDHQC